MRWREVPRPAKAYILYHTIVSPLLFSWTILPVYLLMTGYSILEIGAFFSLVNLASIPLVYLMGKLFNTRDIKKGLVIIDVFEGVANVMYGLSSGTLAPFCLFAGRTLEEIAGMLYPLYRAYEQLVYPKDRYEEVLVWHLRIPEISTILSYPIMGYMLGYVFTGPEAFRTTFLLFGFSSAFTVTYIILFMAPASGKVELDSEGLTFRFREFGFLVLVDALMVLAFSLAPEMVLANYIVVKLRKTVFEVALVKALMSVASIIGTYVADAFPSDMRFSAMGLGMSLYAVNTMVMSISPSLPLVLLANAIGSVGGSIWFPFYRSWMFSLIPENKVGELHAVISSLRRVIFLVSPFVAGTLASLNPTLPYTVSLFIFASTAGILVIFGVLNRSRG